MSNPGNSGQVMSLGQQNKSELKTLNSLGLASLVLHHQLMTPHWNELTLNSIIPNHHINQYLCSNNSICNITQQLPLRQNKKRSINNANKLTAIAHSSKCSECKITHN